MTPARRSGFSREQEGAGDSRLKRNAAQPLLQDWPSLGGANRV